MQVNLSWPSVTNATRYLIYRGTSSGGPYSLIGLSNPVGSSALTTYQDGPGGLVNGQNYFYTVSAMTVDGESSYSPEFAATAPSQPPAPISLTGTIL
jgi:hypothetical protein